MTVAWMVIYGEFGQYKALFLDRARAEQYANDSHGVIRPLIFGDEDGE